MAVRAGAEGFALPQRGRGAVFIGFYKRFIEQSEVVRF